MLRVATHCVLALSLTATNAAAGQIYRINLLNPLSTRPDGSAPNLGPGFDGRGPSNTISVLRGDGSSIGTSARFDAQGNFDGERPVVWGAGPTRSTTRATSGASATMTPTGRAGWRPRRGRSSWHPSPSPPASPWRGSAESHYSATPGLGLG